MLRKSLFQSLVCTTISSHKLLLSNKPSSKYSCINVKTAVAVEHISAYPMLPNVLTDEGAQLVETFVIKQQVHLVSTIY